LEHFVQIPPHRQKEVSSLPKQINRCSATVYLFYRVLQSVKHLSPELIKTKKDKRYRGPFFINPFCVTDGSIIAVLNGAVVFDMTNSSIITILDGSITFNISNS
jgi:hypothetical protein